LGVTQGRIFCLVDFADWIVTPKAYYIGY
jgi:hypothetical protein